MNWLKVSCVGSSNNYYIFFCITKYYKESRAGCLNTKIKSNWLQQLLYNFIFLAEQHFASSYRSETGSLFAEPPRRLILK